MSHVALKYNESSPKKNISRGNTLNDIYTGNLPKRYTNGLSLSDRKKQIRMLRRSKKVYARHVYKTRKKLPSYKHKTSRHILKAQRIYGVKSMVPNAELARKTGCPLSVLKAIVRRGEGAYFSSGSRPNQTPQSWVLLVWQVH